MKKKLLLLFIAAGMLVCVVPFAGMALTRSEEPLGNETKAKMPSVTDKNGSFNPMYFQQLGGYFEKTFAFRPQMINADANIQSGVFQTSNLDTVVTGTDGWLYYSSTLDDYLGRNVLSKRSINSIVYNLEMVERYVESEGASFVFTVAPNKNTLYPEHMPYYYSAKASGDKNITRFKSALKKSALNYCDLFEPFENSDETLYLKQDSHWNNKGALMAYNKIMDSAGKEHNDFGKLNPVREKTFTGDLAKMLYPVSAEPEYNYNYGLESRYSYKTPTKSVEDAMIRTESKGGTGSLYMYRDSFGNSLLPFFAAQYQSAYFTKAFPVNLQLDMLTQKPDTVVFEIVERNLKWFAENPPVIPSLSLIDSEGFSLKTVLDEVEKSNEKTGAAAAVSEVNMQYIQCSGSVPEKLCTDDSRIYLKTTDINGKTRLFAAYSITNESTDCAFTAYLPAAELPADKLTVSAVINDGSKNTELAETQIEIKSAEI